VAIGLLVLGAIVAAFIFVLRKPTRAALKIAEKSIAVLPFENLSEDKANAYFAEGIQDEILTRLSKIADLKVSRALPRNNIRVNPAIFPKSLGNSAWPTSWKGACKEAARSCALTCN